MLTRFSNTTRILAAILMAMLVLGGTGPVIASAGNHPATIVWAGRTWYVKSGDGIGPGPNNWRPDNAFVDANGYLHLTITNVNGVWYCGEIWTTENLGFGKYQFWVESRLDQLDKNVVLGLFSYAGPDGQNEIDVEYARWGDTTYPPGNFTVYPTVAGYRPATRSFDFTLNGTYTTSRYTWQSNRVDFQALHGFQSGNQNLIYGWRYAPPNYLRRIPQQPMPAHLNLWLLQGMPPSDGQPVEVIVHQFTYTP